MKMTELKRILTAICCAAFCFAAAARAGVDNAAVAQRRAAFIGRMVEQHGFDRASLAATLDGIHIDDQILATIAKPAERVVPWYEYRKIFLTPERIETGAAFWRQHAAEVAAASRRYGVAPEMLVAILGIETYFGQRMGHYRVLDALGTLAFAYPPRADFFASELEAFLLISRREGPAMLGALGSYAGAMGAGQFIPTSFEAYAVDADGDGRRDLWHDWSDILGSVANYFSKHGWQRGGPVAERATFGAQRQWSAERDGESSPVRKAAESSRAGKGASPHGRAPAPAAPTARFRLDHKVAELRALGYEFSLQRAAALPAGIVALEGEGGSTEYWVGYRNFAVIMRYNGSPKYALAAYELSRAIRSAYLGSPAR
ncbi:MAG TPA: lytic murein transglycosylase [Gammaproteobacteria bacterium]|nr:lytic murein transglycosylase [Gammaproteobacteria bacterium]